MDEPLGGMEVVNDEDDPTGEGEGDGVRLSALAVLAVPDTKNIRCAI